MNDGRREYERGPRDYEREGESSALSPELPASLARLFATGLGIIAILIGLWCSTKLFYSIYDILTGPEGFEGVVQKWAEAVGGDDLTIQIEETRIPTANLAAVLVLGAGGFLLAWLAIAIMLTGAKIVSWTSSEREAVKRILEHVLGPRSKQS